MGTTSKTQIAAQPNRGTLALRKISLSRSISTWRKQSHKSPTANATANAAQAARRQRRRDVMFGERVILSASVDLPVSASISVASGKASRHYCSVAINLAGDRA